MKKNWPVFAFLLFSSSVYAAEFRCEVLNIKGLAIAAGADSADRNLKQGDLLKAGEEVTVGDDSYVDLAYDKDWQNVTRLEANTRIKIVSVAPTKLSMQNGSIFSKLKKLPKDSEFELKTPTAVATVRGTEYKASYLKGKTEFFNASSSVVYVYGLKEDGSANKETEVILKEATKTDIAKAGDKPAEPVKMTDEEKVVTQKTTSAIQENIQEAQTQGRTGNIQSVDEIEKYVAKEKKKNEIHPTVAKNDSELSRVTDNRRRTFGGQNAMAPPQAPEESSSEDSKAPAPPRDENSK